MYMHLLIEADAARQLYDAEIKAAAREEVWGFAPQSGTKEPFGPYFRQYLEKFLHGLDCTMRIERDRKLFSLRFNRYLPEVPQILVDMDIPIVSAEIIRFQSAPIKARAGFYRWPGKDGDATATVERVFPTQREQGKKFAPLYTQNITVRAGSLKDVKTFNTKLSLGHFGRFLVDAWE